MKNSCLWSFVLATCALLIPSTAAVAQSSPLPITTLIVRAQMDMEDQGAPTHDIPDLEELFAESGLRGTYLFLLVLFAAEIAGLCIIGIARKRFISRHRDTLHRRLKEALTLKVKTDNFCHAAAAAKRDEILASHSAIEDWEAIRLTEANNFAAFYREIARYGARCTGLAQPEIIEIMRQAHGWQYRVLQEAKRQSLEAAR